jgi:hypothetical protein
MVEGNGTVSSGKAWAIKILCFIFAFYLCLTGMNALELLIRPHVYPPHRVPAAHVSWQTLVHNCCHDGSCVRDRHHVTYKIEILESANFVNHEYKLSRTPGAQAALSHDGKELADIYANDNHSFFHDRLPEATFSYVLIDPQNDMAETTYSKGVPNIAIDPKWMDANITKYLLMFHEECHILADSQGDNMKHGKHWRACMLNLEAQGAFRDILVYGLEDHDR